MRITVDPITRIEGHLRIDCEVDDGRVANAWASGQMWRGIELILKVEQDGSPSAFTSILSCQIWLIIALFGAAQESMRAIAGSARRLSAASSITWTPGEKRAKCSS